jgi:hypothetical protein
MPQIVDAEVLNNEGEQLFDYLMSRKLSDGDRAFLCDFVAKSIRERLAFKANVITQYQLGRERDK